MGTGASQNGGAPADPRGLYRDYEGILGFLLWIGFVRSSHIPVFNDTFGTGSVY